MGMLEMIKEALMAAKKIGNVEIQQTLIEVQKQILDTQQEISQLRAENDALRDISELEKKIVRNKSLTVVVLNDDEDQIPYCSRCWDADRKLVQIIIVDNGKFSCPNKDCQNQGMFDKEMNTAYHKRMGDSLKRMNNELQRKSPWQV